MVCRFTDKGDSGFSGLDLSRGSLKHMLHKRYSFRAHLAVGSLPLNPTVRMSSSDAEVVRRNKYFSASDFAKASNRVSASKFQYFR